MRGIGRDFDAVFAARIREADEFYAGIIPATLTPDERAVMRQAFAGLLWSKQFYHYVVRDWLEGRSGARRRRRPRACTAATATGRSSTTPT